jgi:hypothetical protein
MCVRSARDRSLSASNSGQVLASFLATAFAEPSTCESPGRPRSNPMASARARSSPSRSARSSGRPRGRSTWPQSSRKFEASRALSEAVAPSTTPEIAYSRSDSWVNLSPGGPTEDEVLVVRRIARSAGPTRATKDATAAWSIHTTSIGKRDGRRRVTCASLRVAEMLKTGSRPRPKLTCVNDVGHTMRYPGAGAPGSSCSRCMASACVRNIESTSRLALEVTRAKTLSCSVDASTSVGAG